MAPVSPRLGKVRVRGHWQTSGHGEARRQARVYEVFGPTGLVVWRGESFTAAMGHADRESRRKEWREAAGQHQCSGAALLSCRPVEGDQPGIYCGHGRFIGEGDWFLVGPYETQLGVPTITPPHEPTYIRGGVL